MVASIAAAVHDLVAAEPEQALPGLLRQGVEATLFATLMSVLNGGAFCGSALGSGLTAAFGVTATDFRRLAPLVVVRPRSATCCLTRLGRQSARMSSRCVVARQSLAAVYLQSMRRACDQRGAQLPSSCG